MAKGRLDPAALSYTVTPPTASYSVRMADTRQRLGDHRRTAMIRGSDREDGGTRAWTNSTLCQAHHDEMHLASPCPVNGTRRPKRVGSRLGALPDDGIAKLDLDDDEPGAARAPARTEVTPCPEQCPGALPRPSS